MNDNNCSELKWPVRDFWERESCGEVYASGGDFDAHAKRRYELEPFIFEFARFHEGTDRDVLEIGVGMGADHLQWAKSKPRSLTGIDLTARAIQHTHRRLAAHGRESHLVQGDAECLEFAE